MQMQVHSTAVIVTCHQNHPEKAARRRNQKPENAYDSQKNEKKYLHAAIRFPVDVSTTNGFHKLSPSPEETICGWHIVMAM